MTTRYSDFIMRYANIKDERDQQKSIKGELTMKTATFTSPVEYGDEVWVNDIIVENGKVTAVESYSTKVMCVEFFADKKSPFIYTHSGRYLAEDVFMDEEQAKKNIDRQVKKLEAIWADNL